MLGFLPGADTSELEEMELIKAMVGRQIDDLYGKAAQRDEMISDEIICEINGFRSILLGEWCGRMGEKVGYNHTGLANIWPGRIGGRYDSRGVNRNHHPVKRTTIWRGHHDGMAQ